MISPAEVHSAYDLAYAVAIPLYFLLGYSGFYAFGVFNSGAAPPYHPASPHHAAPYPATPLAMLHPLPGANFLLNFPDGAPVRALMVATAVFGYLPLSYGSILLFLKVTRAPALARTLTWILGGGAPRLPSPSDLPPSPSDLPPISLRSPSNLPLISLHLPPISLRSPSDLPPISI